MTTRNKPPAPGAPFDEWTPYALAFDGYAHAGGHAEAEAVWAAACEEIARTGRASGSHAQLRTALFFHQRHMRWIYQGPVGQDEQDADQRIADALLEALARTSGK